MSFMRPTKEEAKKRIIDLVDSFSRNLNDYKNVSYKEQRVRQEYIDLFFEALGWDIRNEEKVPDKYKEVIIEDNLIIKGKSKAPDYAFNYWGSTKFYVEAKKPFVDIKNDVAPALQVRSYAYTKKLPVSILTDFEEFSVYDTKIKPKEGDKPSIARDKYIYFTDYEKEFDYIWDTFSYESVKLGLFDKSFNNVKNKKGTGEIDTELLNNIESWRLFLAKNIALRNTSLSLRNLNLAVQRIIDRIIFLRIAEDKEIEPYCQLKDTTLNKGVYESLKSVFKKANDKYNSGLFEPVEFIDCLTIDDRVLKDIIEELYPPKCPYAWEVLPIEILGNIYETFLGSEITFRNVKGGHTAQVEQKPEIKKAGGVFYTPQYIVDYMVSQTLGKTLNKVSFEEADNLKIIDPSCGSGSFLIGAYKYLLKWYLDYYTKDDTQKEISKKNGLLIETVKGTQLTIEEKKRILVNHIYGVDLDNQAVEVAKLSLFLQMLEESESIKDTDLKILPNMSSNIKSGNSLIGKDFYVSHLDLIDDEDTQFKVNAFEWKEEFKDIFDNGGFDIVIGNPPYISFFKMVSKELKDAYAKAGFSVFNSTGDIYSLFYEKGISILKDGGLLAFITSNKWMRATYGKELRDFFSKQNPIVLIDLGPGVFKNATVDTNILIMEKDSNKNNLYGCNAKTPESRINLKEYFDTNKSLIPNVSKESWFIGNDLEYKLKEKIEKIGTPLRDWDVTINRGILTGYNDAFIIDTEKRNEIINNCATEEERERTEKIIKPILRGRDIKRYEYNWANLWVINTHNGLKKEGLAPIDIKDYPAIKSHLDQYKECITDRTDKGITPYNLRNCVYLNDFDKDKIVWAGVGSRIQYVMLEKGKYLNAPASFLTSKNGDVRYLLGILNSNLIYWYTCGICLVLGASGTRLRNVDVLKLPIPQITDNNRHIANDIENLVDKIMENKKSLKDIKDLPTTSPQDIKVKEDTISMLEKAIDKKVYELYELTDDEIKIIEK